MPDSAVVQRFTQPPGCQLLSMERATDDQAGVKVRDLYKLFKPARPEDLDFTLPLIDVASFPDTLNWDTRQSVEDLPRIARAIRQSGGFLLIVMGGGGSCLIAEMLNHDEVLTANALVRVHPYPLRIPLDQSLVIHDISFGITAGNHADESHITIGADPGVGPDSVAPPSTACTCPKPTPSQQNAILTVLDQEILAWGEAFAAVHKSRPSGHSGWPVDLCRHVLPSKDHAAELARVNRAVAIRAYEKFAPDSSNELVVGLFAPNRPLIFEADEQLVCSAFVNLRNEIVPDAMRAWIEETLHTVLAAKWTEGWYEVIGPDKSSRLGVQSQMPKTFAKVRRPFSNHQRMDAMSVLGSLY